MQFRMSVAASMLVLRAKGNRSYDSNHNRQHASLLLPNTTRAITTATSPGQRRSAHSLPSRCATDTIRGVHARNRRPNVEPVDEHKCRRLAIDTRALCHTLPKTAKACLRVGDTGVRRIGRHEKEVALVKEVVHQEHAAGIESCRGSAETGGSIWIARVV